MITFDDVMDETRKNDRVSPQPARWQELYELLPDKKRLGNGWEPALPLILAAWTDAPHLSKSLRLREHIDWASTHGCLDDVYKFLTDLPENDGYHGSD